MDVAKTNRGPVAVLSIRGAVMAGELDALDKAIEECIKAGIQKLVLDMEKVPFIDSAGLEMVLDIAERLGKVGRDVRVAGLNQICRDIFTVTMMEKLVITCPDQDAAIKELA